MLRSRQGDGVPLSRDSSISALLCAQVQKECAVIVYKKLQRHQCKINPHNATLVVV
jgi:hypothetical protein